MKISDVAKQYGVSKQAVYQRLKRAGVSVEALTAVAEANNAACEELRESILKG